MRHTEGPWYYTEDEVVDGNGFTIADASARRHFPGVEANDPDVEAEIQANVCLMAAAPDLLAACEAATEWFQRNGEEYAGDIEVYNQLRAALLKAKGGAS